MWSIGTSSVLVRFVKLPTYLAMIGVTFGSTSHCFWSILVHVVLNPIDLEDIIFNSTAMAAIVVR